MGRVDEQLDRISDRARFYRQSLTRLLGPDEPDRCGRPFGPGTSLLLHEPATIWLGIMATLSFGFVGAVLFGFVLVRSKRNQMEAG
jgi:hypothetical protein